MRKYYLSFLLVAILLLTVVFDSFAGLTLAGCIGNNLNNCMNAHDAAQVYVGNMHPDLRLDANNDGRVDIIDALIWAKKS